MHITRDGSAASARTSSCAAIRSTSASFNFAGTPYWTHNAPANLRAPAVVTSGNRSASYFYDGATSPTAITATNLTRVQQNDSASGGVVAQSWAYLPNGNVTVQTDARGVNTAICYDSNAFPSLRVSGASSTACPNPAPLNEGRKSSSTYSSSGYLGNETDLDNGIATAYTYDDTGRTIKVEQTAGGLDRVSTTVYNDVELTSTVTQDDTAQQKLVTKTSYDALGRVVLVQDPANNQMQKGLPVR